MVGKKSHSANGSNPKLSTNKPGYTGSQPPNRSPSDAKDKPLEELGQNLVHGEELDLLEDSVKFKFSPGVNLQTPGLFDGVQLAQVPFFRLRNPAAQLRQSPPRGKLLQPRNRFAIATDVQDLRDQISCHLTAQRDRLLGPCRPRDSSILSDKGICPLKLYAICHHQTDFCETRCVQSRSP